MSGSAAPDLIVPFAPPMKDARSTTPVSSVAWKAAAVIGFHCGTAILASGCGTGGESSPAELPTCDVGEILQRTDTEWVCAELPASASSLPSCEPGQLL